MNRYSFFAPIFLWGTVLIGGCDLPDRSTFEHSWQATADRRWVGPAFWANRLQDWHVADGRLESTNALPMRTVHLLTRRLGEGSGSVRITTILGPVNTTEADSGRSSGGVLLGAGRGLDYRAASLIHHSYGPRAGLYVGVDTEGRLFLRDIEHEDLVIIATQTPRGPIDSVSLEITVQPEGETYQILARAALWNADRDAIQVTTGGLSSERLTGNVALVADSRGDDPSTFWFSKLDIRGTKVKPHDDRALGPIIGTQHTLSRGTLTLTAQLTPVDDAHASAELQIRAANGRWQSVATAPVVVPGYTATLRVDNWDTERDIPYRLVYSAAGSEDPAVPHVYGGMVRAEPLDKDDVIVAALTGNGNAAFGVDRAWFPWNSGLWFPHSETVEHVRAHDPDFLFFSGDQIYEGGSPTRADFTQPLEDYLYKWYLWLWAFRDLTADIPTVTIPDDHDVYHGNIWGAGGKATPAGLAGAAAQDAGGYKLSPEFVNMVQRTQTSHLPTPHDPTPVEQDIGLYYTDILYGGVSFAVLEDRKFKSAPGPLLPRAQVWNGWPLNERFDPRTEADHPDADLLGERQLEFLEEWAADWSDGTWMKVVLSQTLFANVATLPDTARTGSVLPSLRIPEPGEYPDNDRIATDMDSNGWPQTGRNRALRALRKGYAVHLAGDQHLGTTVQYGAEQWGDAAFALGVPSIANFWPRRWFPPTPGTNRRPDAPRYTGDYEDGFGNKITVHAVSNPHRSGKDPERLHDRAPGYGIARFNRATRRITLEAWPRWADPTAGDSPYPGWPISFQQSDNYGREAVAYLSPLEIVGLTDPVVQVIEERTGDVVFTIRVVGAAFTPHVFAEGSYAIGIGEPGTEHWKVLEGIEATPTPGPTRRIDLRSGQGQTDPPAP